MIFKKYLIAIVITFVFYTFTFATNYHIGPDRVYKTLQEVTNRVNPGDTVFVDGGNTYPGGIEFERTGEQDNPIVILGIPVDGKRPILSGGTNTIQFSTYPYDQPGADHYILEGFEITGGSKRGVFHQAHDLTIRNTVVRNCPEHGILGADQGSGSLYLEFVEVYGCGSGTLRHQLYIATDQTNRPGSVLRMKYCYIHDGNGGNNLKSRAERNEIYYNWFENAYYHELELIGPEYGDPALKREDSDVVGNVIWDRNDFYLVRIGGDGTGETNGRYRFLNNTFICNSRAAFRLFDGVESVEMHNNVFYRAGAGSPKIISDGDVNWTSGSELISGYNNWVESGSQFVPSQWTGTIAGTEPGFVNINSSNLRPASDSPVINKGSESYTSPDEYEFPNPLKNPVYEPPVLENWGENDAVLRHQDEQIDIGPYEYKEINVIHKSESIKLQGILLKQNYPNPFNPTTQISFTIPGYDSRLKNIRLTIYNSLGQQIKVLAEDSFNAGSYQITWNGTNLNGITVPSGIYVYQLQSGSLVQNKKMILIR